MCTGDIAPCAGNAVATSLGDAGSRPVHKTDLIYALSCPERGHTISGSDTPPVDPAASGTPAPAPETSTGDAPPPDAPTTIHVEQPAPRPGRRRRWIITVVLLSVALLATGAALTLTLLWLDDTLATVDEQGEQIEEQRDLIDKKETFGSAAQELMNTAAQFDGVPFAALVDTRHHQSLIQRGWRHRWDSVALERDIDEIHAATAELADVAAAAKEQASSNESGTFFERTTDALGKGFITTSLNSAIEVCDDEDALGCVSGEDPMVIHYSSDLFREAPYDSNFLREGVAYHEYAHVLQMTNPETTAEAVKAFDGDWETMADCYALTYLKDWKLDHTIWINSYSYWEISIGYGYTCNSDQRRAIREWVDALGYVHEPISQ